MRKKYDTVIGLEVHAQLKTDSKIFCSCSTDFGKPPNTQVCPVCLGMPGVLPVLNKKVVEMACKTALAMNCTVNNLSVFARKNYFYPDLPKGYQISQYELPLAENGYLEIETGNNQYKKIGITRIHLEEDAGKSLHPEGKEGVDYTRIDINRCGVPLIEIVSEPDITNPTEASLYVQKLRQILIYLEVCDGSMEQGSLRCDANVSIMPEGSEKFGVKTEVKNMNSFKAIERALEFEIERQIKLVEAGGNVVQETRFWDSTSNRAITMRTKEESHDYRYFPEPDLMPLKISDEWKDHLKKEIPELPNIKKSRFIKQYKIPEYNAEILTTDKNLADYFETGAKTVKDNVKLSNWIMGEVLRVLKEKKLNIDEFIVKPNQLAELVNLIDNAKVSQTAAKDVFELMVESGKDPAVIVKEEGLEQVSDDSVIQNIVEKIIKDNPKEIDKYISGKDKLFGFFMGQAMRELKGKGDPKVVKALLKEKLDSLK